MIFNREGLRRQLQESCPDSDVVARLHEARRAMLSTSRQLTAQIEVVDKLRGQLRAELRSPKPGADDEWGTDVEKSGGNPKRVTQLRADVAAAEQRLKELESQVAADRETEAAVMDEMVTL